MFLAFSLLELCEKVENLRLWINHHFQPHYWVYKYNPAVCKRWWKINFYSIVQYSEHVLESYWPCASFFSIYHLHTYMKRKKNLIFFSTEICSIFCLCKYFYGELFIKGGLHNLKTVISALKTKNVRAGHLSLKMRKRIH